MEATIKKQLTKREFAMQYFKNIAGSKFENYKDYIYIFEYEKNGVISCAIFEKRGSKPSSHYRFKSIEQRQNFVNEQKKHAETYISWEAQRLEKNLIESAQYLPGAIVYDSWGYDQTNIDFYLITERKNNTLILVQIGANKEYSHSMSGTTTPDTSKIIGEPFKKRISQTGSIHLNGYSCTSLYDGKPKMFSEWA